MRIIYDKDTQLGQGRRRHPRGADEIEFRADDEQGGPLILVGLDCEHAFLHALLEASKNPGIQKGKPGYVD